MRATFVTTYFLNIKEKHALYRHLRALLMCNRHEKQNKYNKRNPLFLWKYQIALLSYYSCILLVGGLSVNIGKGFSTFKFYLHGKQAQIKDWLA